MPKAPLKSSNRGASRSNPLSTKGDPSDKKMVPKSAKNTNSARALGSPVSDQSYRAQSASNGDNEDFNYLLHVRILDTRDPMITRLLSVPSSIDFDKLHEILQIAFGWASYHMYTFNVIAKPALHGAGDLASYLTLRDVFEKKEWEGQSMLGVMYMYDMGDAWRHEITLLGRADNSLSRVMASKNGIFCISGEGHPCAEDCGSTPGWKGLKEAFTKSEGDEELKHWYKTHCVNGDKKGLNPYQWSISEVNKKLGKVKEQLGKVTM